MGDPHAIALSCLADGMMTMARGEWKPALKFSEEALAILRDRCVGVTWELNMAQNLVIWALMYLGELGDGADHRAGSAQNGQRQHDCAGEAHPITGQSRPSHRWAQFGSETAHRVATGGRSVW